MILRKTLLFLGQQRWLKHWMKGSRLARPLVRRFVAGDGLEDAMRVCGRLKTEGILCTLDHLGENVTTQAEAESSLQSAFDSIAQLPHGSVPATVSIKLTQFGLDLSESLCRELVMRLAVAADAAGTGIEIDMEASAYVERTLKLVRKIHSQTGNVRAVIQAYLHRSQTDVEALCLEGILVRLCKGAYLEPPEIALQDKREVDQNYDRLMNYLLEHGRVPALATHDHIIIENAIRKIQDLGLRKHQYEFQMLYGVRRNLQNKLVRTGHPLRLYVPYGDAWYPYFMRRLAERPANVLFLIRQLVSH